MPLKNEVKVQVQEYLFRDLVPKNERHLWPIPMDWFIEQFNYIPDKTLRNHLAEAFYQARLAGRIQESLGLVSKVNHLFLKSQILLYASVFEAVIDYCLEKKKGSPEISELFEEKNFKEISGAMSASTKITYDEGGTTHNLFTCRLSTRKKKLKEIQFKTRVDASVTLGIVLKRDSELIKELYEDRNNIHILNSAKNDFSPTQENSSNAFVALFRFLDSSKKWVKENSKLFKT